MRALPDSHRGTGILQAWWAGEELEPEAIHAALNVEARLAAEDEDVANEMIALALSRMKRAFPELS